MTAVSLTTRIYAHFRNSSGGEQITVKCTALRRWGLRFCYLSLLIGFCAPLSRASTSEKTYAAIPIFYSYDLFDSGYSGPDEGAACAALVDRENAYMTAHNEPWSATPVSHSYDGYLWANCRTKMTNTTTGSAYYHNTPITMAFDCHGDILGGTDGAVLPHYIIHKHEGEIKEVRLRWDVQNPSFGWTCLEYDTISAPKLRLIVTSDGHKASTDVGSSPIVARLPLGAEFSFELTRKSDGGAIASSYTLSKPSLKPDIIGATLFPDNPVLEFDAATTAKKKQFRAVHMGAETLTITPSDGSLSPVTVNVTINKPASLGTRYGKYDEGMVYWANQRGIPPQFLKGQIERESAFNPKSYRYEPLGADLAYISAGANTPSAWPYSTVNKRTKWPYSSYRLTTKDGLSQGDRLIEEDISPRQMYYVYVPTGDCCNEFDDYFPYMDFIVDGDIRKIEPVDIHVPALDIYWHNPHQNWPAASNQKRVAEVRKDPGLLNFTAQTTIAASYGLLQVMYDTAVGPMKWQGVQGDRNPSYLFDVDPNNEKEGDPGTLILGTGYFVGEFVSYEPEALYISAQYQTDDQFKAIFTCIYNRYNHGLCGGNYGSDVMKFSRPYHPVPSSAIFQ